ncbi:MAG: Chromosome segregation and condensation protein, ScpB [Parcubacteria group bacterium GW2011_GWB1_43_8]|nr:MAG: Chromosome segregation and condensation protein, ScpB [Parcubacteria group bacterium GW2011_GWB1_43_8]
MDKLIIQLESILFLKGEPVSVSWLAKTLDKKEEEINISLEHLSEQLIIYKNTASRAEIDYIRGVNSSFILRNLLVRGLIEREVKRGEDRSYVYKPSLSLLEHLGVKSLEELPDFVSISAKLKEFLNAENGENKKGQQH